MCFIRDDNVLPLCSEHRRSVECKFRSTSTTTVVESLHPVASVIVTRSVPCQFHSLCSTDPRDNDNGARVMPEIREHYSVFF